MLKYKQVFSQLQWELKAGKYPRDSALPCERELARRYQVSQKTIHNAMALLETKGHIEKRHGSGNYVCESHSGKKLESLAVILNCNPNRSTDFFFENPHFMLHLSAVSQAARVCGVGTELFVYNDELITGDLLENCNARYFINLSFTAVPELEKILEARQGRMISTLNSFHYERYQRLYHSPCVVCDFAPGIRAAFQYYAACGFQYFVFFAQAEPCGRRNLELYAQLGRESGLSLNRRLSGLYTGREATGVYCRERQAWILRRMLRLPEKTLIFCDGSHYLREVASLLPEQVKWQKKQETLHFCAVGKPDHDGPELQKLQNLDWILPDYAKTARLACQLLIGEMQDNQLLPPCTLVPASFQPGH